MVQARAAGGAPVWAAGAWVAEPIALAAGICPVAVVEETETPSEEVPGDSTDPARVATAAADPPALDLAAVEVLAEVPGVVAVAGGDRRPPILGKSQGAAI